MAPGQRATPSLQSLIDTYRLLMRGVKGEPATSVSYGATTAARNIAVPRALKQKMIASLRTLPVGLTVAGLSTASLRVRDNLFLFSDGIRPLCHADESDLLPLSVSQFDAQNDPPNAEWHRWLYANSDVKAILVAHATCAANFAVQRIAPDPACFPAGARQIRQVTLVSADPAGWLGIPEPGSVLLVEDGALVACDKNLECAIAKAGILSRWCEIQMASMSRQRNESFQSV